MKIHHVFPYTNRINAQPSRKKAYMLYSKVCFGRKLHFQRNSAKSTDMLLLLAIKWSINCAKQLRDAKVIIKVRHSHLVPSLLHVKY